MMFLLLISLGILEFTTLTKVLGYMSLVLAITLGSIGVFKRFKR